MIKHICEEDKCTGCGACSQVCPQKCISLDYNPEGFLFPQIAGNCIDCGLCVRTCPVNNPVSLYKALEGYTAHSKDKDILLGGSSSGGIFSELAKAVIDKNGTVFGAAFSKGFDRVLHSSAEKTEDTVKLRGSKYIQSETGSVFIEVKRLLKEGRYVLFTGTPCQIAGLRAYLNKDYDKLYTMDFMCHGVASTLMFRKFISSLSLPSEIQSINFRGKEGGYNMLCTLSVRLQDDSEIRNPWYQSSLGLAYANNIISRTSCGKCRYAKPARTADITVADYNHDEITEFEKQYGASAVLINTLKGKILFNDIKKQIEFKPINLDDYLENGLHYNNPAYPHKNRDIVFKRVLNMEYSELADKYFCPYEPKFSLKNSVKRRIVKVLKNTINK